jgi:hypothetical protein
MKLFPKSLVLVVLASLAINSSVVQASPRAVKRDRTDNGFSFSYDGNEGEIDTATSSMRIERGDPVNFVIYIRDNPSSDTVGSRLRARLTLSLNKDRARRYLGRFSFEIKDATGTVVYTDGSDHDVRLRPRKGQRQAAITFVFDLPSGDYSAEGLFEAEE